MSPDPKALCAAALALLAGVAPAYVVAGDPAGARTSAYDGVGQVRFTLPTGGALMSGTLLETGRHVLTAAHGFTNGSGAPIASGVFMRFSGAEGTVDIAASRVIINPGWSGNLFGGADIAIVELSREADAWVDRSPLYAGSAEVGAIGRKVGFGESGTGATGATINDLRKRTGRNRWDTDATAFDPIPSARFADGSGVLLYDFDDGTAARDALGFYDDAQFGGSLGLADTGLGLDEAMTGRGDSGGPTFIGDAIAGVTSFRLRLEPWPPDVDGDLNSSFGEIGGDTRVSSFLPWLNGTIGIPSPGAVAIAVPAVLIIAGRVRAAATA